MEIYTVQVAVKSYIRSYLENNFGNPADIRLDPELNEMFSLLLREGSTRLDKIISATYPTTVNIQISKDVFFRYGFTLTKTETLKFNSFLEKRIKFFMRTYIAYHQSLGYSTAECIRDFQLIFGFSEDVWPFDSIKKDFDRNGSHLDRKFIRNFKDELSHIFLEMLSELGTPFKPVPQSGQNKINKNG